MKYLLPHALQTQLPVSLFSSSFWEPTIRLHRGLFNLTCKVVLYFSCEMGKVECIFNQCTLPIDILVFGLFSCS